MPRETFERELQRLQDEMLIMADWVENAITESVETLKQRDMEGSRRLIAQDRTINRKRFAIEAGCLIAIATQQPTATDLRVLAAILDITTELERIGDYAKGIARINLMIREGPLLKPLIDIPCMAEQTREMLQQALEAFLKRNVALAQEIPTQDKVIDEMFNQVYRVLMSYAISDPKNMGQVNYLLWAAHNLERAADRVTNICERVLFTVTGELVELDSDTAGVESIS